MLLQGWPERPKCRAAPHSGQRSQMSQGTTVKFRFPKHWAWLWEMPGAGATAGLQPLCCHPLFFLPPNTHCKGSPHCVANEAEPHLSPPQRGLLTLLGWEPPEPQPGWVCGMQRLRAELETQSSPGWLPWQHRCQQAVLSQRGSAEAALAPVGGGLPPPPRLGHWRPGTAARLARADREE